MKEIDELDVTVSEMIALDAISRKRTDNGSLAEFIFSIRKKYPTIKLMTDIAILKELLFAEK